MSTELPPPPGPPPGPPLSGPPPPQPPYQPGYPQAYQPGFGPAQDAQYAMPAMVLGIVSLVLLPLACCCGIGGLLSVILGILAIVFGVMARNRITASQGALGGGGKAMAGIVTGGVAVFLAAVLIILVLALGLSSGSLANYFNTFASPSP